jgi:hypothetical protein
MVMGGGAPASAAVAQIAQSHMGQQQLGASPAAQRRQRDRGSADRRALDEERDVDVDRAGTGWVASDQWAAGTLIGATLVRHFICGVLCRDGAQRAPLARSPARTSRGMLEPAARAALVVPGGLAPPLAPPNAGASPAAILLAVVAMRAQQDLVAATRAQEKTG